MVIETRQLARKLPTALRSFAGQAVLQEALARRMPLHEAAGLFPPVDHRVVNAGALVEAAAMLLEDGYSGEAINLPYLVSTLTDALRRYGLQVSQRDSMADRPMQLDDRGPDGER